MVFLVVRGKRFYVSRLTGLASFLVLSILVNLGFATELLGATARTCTQMRSARTGVPLPVGHRPASRLARAFFDL